MVRKSNWLPQNSEPGSSGSRWRDADITPLDDITGGVLSLLGAAAVAILALANRDDLNLLVVVIAVVADVGLLLLAAYTLRLGIRRSVWRKRNVAATGGRYLRPWERYTRRQR